MASSSPKLHRATYIDLPDTAVAHSKGLALDIGGSAIKIVYRPKDKSPREGEPPIAEGKQRVRFALYPRRELDEGLKAIAPLVDITRTSENDIPVINTTGIGSSEYKQKISKAFNVKTNNLMEMDQFIRCFKELSQTLPKDDVNDPLHEQGVARAQMVIDAMMNSASKFQEHTEGEAFDINELEERNKVTEIKNDLPYAEADKDLFPCLIFTMGSGIAIIRLNADGTFATIDGTSRGGASFLGLGNLLVGSSSYEELMSLAEKGNDREVTTYFEDFQTTGNDGYAAFESEGSDMIAFNFGKVRDTSTDNFSKASIIRGLVTQYATDITMTAHLRALVDDAQNVFLAGNFTNADVFRYELSKFGVFRSMMTPPGKKSVQFHFLKHGGFYGALGAFLAKDKPEMEKAQEKAMNDESAGSENNASAELFGEDEKTVPTSYSTKL